MKRIYTLATVGVIGFLSAGATLLSPEQALERVGGNGLTRGGVLNHPELIMTKTTITGEPSLYVFGNTAGNGYVILSADDVSAPVLGYADNEAFESNTIPEQLEWWLSEYSRQIQYARDNGIGAYNATRAEREPIAPLLATTWNQNAPYNNETPLMYGYHTPTGCVATAMAQVMKFWNYPEKAMGSGRIVLPGTNKVETILLSEKPLDWSNMLDSYSGEYTNEEADAVSYLMKVCGYSVNMSYALNGSGAVTRNAAKALIDNFHYNSNIQYCSRDYYTLTQWEAMVYNELSNGRPVLYGGQSTSVGHAFVCDGYSSDGFFHFNWGWGGMSDGYFVLDALNPNAVGTGGGEGGGFNFGQDIIIGIQPNKEGSVPCQLTQMGNLSAGYEGGSFVLNLTDDGWWVNMGMSDIDINFGIEIEPLDETGGKPTYITISWKKVPAPALTNTENGTMINYSGWSGNELTVSVPRSLADGKYKLTVCTQSRASKNLPWIPVLASSDCYNYVIFTKSGDNFTFENFPFAEAILEGSSLVSQLYYTCAAKLSVTVSNPSDKEITRGFYPRLYKDDKLNMSGEGIVITLGAGETVTKEFVTLFELESGVSGPLEATDYVLRYVDPVVSNYETDYEYDWEKTVTMNVDTKPLQVEITDFLMPELSYMVEETPREGKQPVYRVYDKNVIPFSCNLTNKGDYFAFPVLVYVFNADLQGNSVAYATMSPTPILSKDESLKVNGLLDFHSGEAGGMYAAAVYVNRYGLQQKSGVIYFRIETSGVEEINTDEGLTMSYDKSSESLTIVSANEIKVVDVFGLDGKKMAVDVSNGNGNTLVVDLSTLPSGMWIVRGVDCSNNIKTIKVMK